MDNHYHDETGAMVLVEPSPAAEDLAATEAVTSAEVEIARINADKEIALAKLANRQVEPELEAQLAAALAELDALRALVAPPEPEPEPEPVVIVQEPEAAPEPAEDSLPAPEPVEDHKPVKKNPWLSQY
jgi:hypothetical protein